MESSATSTTDQPADDAADPFTEFGLHLRDVGDPMYQHHGIRRPASYRAKLALKRLLRDFGFRNEGFLPVPAKQPG